MIGELTFRGTVPRSEGEKTLKVKTTPHRGEAVQGLESDSDSNSASTTDLETVTPRANCLALVRPVPGL